MHIHGSLMDTWHVGKQKKTSYLYLFKCFNLIIIFNFFFNVNNYYLAHPLQFPSLGNPFQWQHTSAVFKWYHFVSPSHRDFAWFCLLLQVRNVPGSTFFVDPGTIFLSENSPNPIITPAPKHNPTHILSLMSEGNDRWIRMV